MESIALYSSLIINIVLVVIIFIAVQVIDKQFDRIQNLLHKIKDLKTQ